MAEIDLLLETALYSADTGTSNHWPMVATVLASEVRRLQDQLASVQVEPLTGNEHIN